MLYAAFYNATTIAVLTATSSWIPKPFYSSDFRSFCFNFHVYAECCGQQWFVNFDHNEFDLSLLHTIIRFKVLKQTWVKGVGETLFNLPTVCGQCYMPQRIALRGMLRWNHRFVNFSTVRVRSAFQNSILKQRGFGLCHDPWGHWKRCLSKLSVWIVMCSK